MCRGIIAFSDQYILCINLCLIILPVSHSAAGPRCGRDAQQDDEGLLIVSSDSNRNTAEDSWASSRPPESSDDEAEPALIPTEMITLYQHR